LIDVAIRSTQANPHKNALIAAGDQGVGCHRKYKETGDETDCRSDNYESRK
jgi:hypothetical protein